MEKYGWFQLCVCVCLCLVSERVSLFILTSFRNKALNFEACHVNSYYWWHSVICLTLGFCGASSKDCSLASPLLYGSCPWLDIAKMLYTSMLCLLIEQLQDWNSTWGKVWGGGKQTITNSEKAWTFILQTFCNRKQLLCTVDACWSNMGSPSEVNQRL